MQCYNCRLNLRKKKKILKSDKYVENCFGIRYKEITKA